MKAARVRAECVMPREDKVNVRKEVYTTFDGTDLAELWSHHE